MTKCVLASAGNYESWYVYDIHENHFNIIAYCNVLDMVKMCAVDGKEFLTLLDYVFKYSEGLDLSAWEGLMESITINK